MFVTDSWKSDIRHWNVRVFCSLLIPESLMFIIDPWTLAVCHWSLKVCCSSLISVAFCSSLIPESLLFVIDHWKFVVRYWTLKFYRSTLNPKSSLFFIDPWKFPVCSAVTWAKAPQKTLGDKHSSTLLKITLKITVNNHWNVKNIFSNGSV